MKTYKNLTEYNSDKNHPAKAMIERTEIEVKCERCGSKININVYRQAEGKYVAYYCHDCRQLLTQIGAGEHTAMQERAGDRPDNTPYTKED